ncbi:MAG: beta-lactamase family protein, partial [Hymenobacteraceae bacterium]|nr:beta-lactamase family protein [Hymenobacteraceae bacterium]MDX5397294.1 beta-lactamase family protein [Hymenobacteraceae bacterium]MDX5513372.1 beta-lactamase family protein [Hymenobacteraceae bacterium]
MKKINLLCLLLICLLWVPVAEAQKKSDIKKIDRYLEDAFKAYDLPGMAVGIVKDGKVVFSKGYGVRSNEIKKPVTPETTFAIASLSKAFAAATLGILVDEGKLNWDDKVSKYLPDFELYDPFIERELTIRDLISHRSGYNTFDGDLLWYGTSYNREEILERFRHMKNKSSFRSGYGYQNIMFIAAGDVVEAVSGQTWDTFVQERIFKPLNMTASF